MTPPAPLRTLYIVVSAAPPSQKIDELVSLAQNTGWDVCIIATPNATQFINKSKLEKLTGHKVRSKYKIPDEDDILPSADAIIAMPATFNTINKLANGIADNLAATILCDALGNGIPIVAVPYLKPTLANHPAFSKSLATLIEHRIHLIYDVERYPSPKIVPWEIVLLELKDVITTYGIQSTISEGDK